MGFLAIAVASLLFRASRRRGLRPFALGALAAITILIGKFYFDSSLTTYLGVALLVAASAWNSWPRGAAAVSPSGFVRTEDILTTKQN
jgi:hypothetical protein